MLFDFIELDLKEKGKLYHTLYSKIKEAVELGNIKSGEKLPSVREAASQLSVSRTTVENAYDRLCIEGIVESLPQKGYYITDYSKRKNSQEYTLNDFNSKILYDFSGRYIDTKLADAEVWKKTVRSVLQNTGELTSYGNAQGEEALREALSWYSYKARGIISKPNDIMVGAGIGPLLNILCGIIDRKVKIGFENEGFKKSQSVFNDYGIETVILESDESGAKLESIEKNNIDILFLTPSSLSKISVTALSRRRNEYEKWAMESENRLIIEDDYNGELRFFARTVPAFQGKLPEKTVYIGSFSKLLLPSVRLAYMVLPISLVEKFKIKLEYINQTCGKIEQLALAEYIKSGNLEKHLRKLRRLYYEKSQLFLNQIRENFPKSDIKLFETSLSCVLSTGLNASSESICDYLKTKGILVLPSLRCGTIKLSFSGIKAEEIETAVKLLKNEIINFWKNQEIV